MAKVSLDSEINDSYLGELSVRYPNRHWFINTFLWQVGLTALAVLLGLILHGEKISLDLFFFRDWLCWTILVVGVGILIRFWPYGCLNRVVFFQDSFEVSTKPILYREIKVMFDTHGMKVNDRRIDKHFIEIRNRTGYVQCISYKDGWTDTQLDQIMNYLTQYEGIEFVNVKHLKRL